MTHIELGRAFADQEVVSLYRHRPPYPTAVFESLARGMVEPRTVLDAGCGTGALARGLREAAARIDAVDPSAAMLDAARGLPGGGDPRIRWQHARAEDAALEAPYGLIVCGASLHWMRHDIVLPRFREVLAPGARLAIVDTETHRVEDAVRTDVLTVIKSYSPIRDHVETSETVDALVAAGRLILERTERTAPQPFEQSVDEYVGFLGSTSTFSRTTLGSRADAFDREMRAVFARHSVDRLRYDVVGFIAWGRPA
jgi:ubiquinone/menaquinone biosynthesis C-methylase UbiE